ncbi:MAG: hypothetical protein PHR78_05000 [Eubacteriales bacterium]|nr:hypothetical protein [Eubacteriales bacterium]MDD4541499.1 hypothetical protein [Eubacteriales bacterium]
MPEDRIEKLLLEIIDLQKYLRSEVKRQDELIRRFQVLTAHDGMFSQIIDQFPWPLAVFAKNGELVSVNQAFESETGIAMRELKGSRISILSENCVDARLPVAVREVFSGKRTEIEMPLYPCTLFLSREETFAQRELEKIIVFPLPGDGELIDYGVIIFID